MPGDDDPFGGDDADLLAALAAAEARAAGAAAAARRSAGSATTSASTRPNPPPPRPPPAGVVQQPAPRKAIVQPTPQRLDRAPPPGGGSGGASGAVGAAAGSAKPVQPTPQPLKGPSVGSAILVSPRQKGNPVLASIRSLPWEYSDIPADYVLGVTTCALFLRWVRKVPFEMVTSLLANKANHTSLKYHRLHPEYIYTRIRNLQGKYQLRILLTLVDITNHEDALRELAKTSLVNNVTVILCWSAAEAGRYLELYKSYEHASFTAIRGQQAVGYADRLVEFVTVPRGVNKTDAVAMVSAFGSLRNAVNADPDALGLVSGWGEKKVQRWCAVVKEPFRVQTAGKRAVEGGAGTGVVDANTASSGVALAKEKQASARSRLDQAVPLSAVPLRDMPAAVAKAAEEASREKGKSAAAKASEPARQAQYAIYDPDDMDEDEEAMVAAAVEESRREAVARAAQSQTKASGSSASAAPSTSASAKPYEMPDGVAAALAKLRQNG